MSTTDPDIAIIETSSLGDRSYLISHDGIAVVIDPQRDIDRVRALAAEKIPVEVPYRCENYWAGSGRVGSRHGSYSRHWHVRRREVDSVG